MEKNEKPVKKRKLTPMQADFAREYQIDRNATKAAIRAGYSAKNADKIGPRLVGLSRVNEVIGREAEKRAERTNITADYVLETIRDTVERCKQGEPVKDRVGHPTGEWKFDSTAVLKGCELLGKHLAMFTDNIASKVDAKVSAEITITPELIKSVYDRIKESC